MKIISSTTILFISAIIFYLEINGIFSIGSFINRYIPCQQNPMNSFPCFGIYDIYFLGLLIIIFIISLIIMGLRIYKDRKIKKLIFIKQ